MNQNLYIFRGRDLSNGGRVISRNQVSVVTALKSTDQ